MNNELIALLWDYMKCDPEHKDRVLTSYGSKTKKGLVASIENIVREYDVMERLANQ